MTTGRSERRLAAILLTDVVGYSRMISADEAGTLRRLKALRREVINPQIAAGHGRIVNATGDAVLAEFPSPVRAVACAVAIQREVAARTVSLPEGQAMQIRVGINVGDVIAEHDGSLYGDGVNVAARLEPLAEPGGLCISRSVYDQIRDRLPYRFEDRGDFEFKNIARPVGVFALSAAAILASPPTSIEDETDAPEPRRTRLRLAAIAGLLAIVIGIGVAWWLGASSPRMAEKTLAVQAGLPPKVLPPLSMVVLPFTNLSREAEQDFFADGITEDMTTEVSRFPGSFVIAANTAFTYKGKAVDVKQIGHELGVRYALEGSVRRAGEKVVLNAQLISTETGANIWADRFEGDRGRLNELQVEFVARLARSLDVELTQAESVRSLRERPNNPDASDLAMRAWAFLNKPRSKDTYKTARSLFEEALKIEPDLPLAILGLAKVMINNAVAGWSENKQNDIEVTNNLIKKYIDLYPNDAVAFVVKGEVFRAMKKFDEAASMYDVAIAINHNLALAHALKGHVSTLSGRASVATPEEFIAIQLSPRDPLINTWYYYVCHASIHLKHWDDAIPWCSKSVALSPYWLAYVDLAAAYAWTGKDAEAKAAVVELLKLMPGYTVQKWANAGWSDNPTFLAEYAYIIEGLRKAGLAEEATSAMVKPVP